MTTPAPTMMPSVTTRSEPLLLTDDIFLLELRVALAEHDDSLDQPDDAQSDDTEEGDDEDERRAEADHPNDRHDDPWIGTSQVELVDTDTAEQDREDTSGGFALRTHPIGRRRRTIGRRTTDSRSAAGAD